MITIIKRKFKPFVLNTNLVRITVSEEHEIVSFEFQNIHNNSDLMNTEFFEMGANGCDLDYFEEFGDSCIIGFKGSELTNQTVIKKAQEVYKMIIKLVKEKKSQKKLKSALTKKKRRTALNKNITFLANCGNFKSAISYAFEYPKQRTKDTHHQLLKNWLL